MNHPEITKLNAKIYHGKALKEAEAYRKTKKASQKGAISALLTALNVH